MEKKQRVGILDELRGFAILCMVVYHLMYNLKYIFGLDVPIFFESWFNYIRDAFAGLFICISGIACNYSQSNLKRGTQCFFIGMVMTFVTSFISSTIPDVFGILHCLGICMMIYGLGEQLLKKIPSVVGILVFVFLFLVTYTVPKGYIGLKDVFYFDLPSLLYSSEYMFPLGFPALGFKSSDYFPLIPWLFLFLAGSYLGVYFKNGVMPKFMYNTHVRFLAATGRNSLWIYVLHQPVIYTILCIVFGKSIF